MSRFDRQLLTVLGSALLVGILGALLLFGLIETIAF
jgi:hypothetical protein